MRELFGRVRFPTPSHTPYPLSLGPHGFYWFQIEARQPDVRTGERPSSVVVELLGEDGERGELVPDERSEILARALLDYVVNRRWFRSKARTPTLARLRGTLSLNGSAPCCLSFLEVSYNDGEPETYALGLRFSSTDDGGRFTIARARLLTRREPVEGYLLDATGEASFGKYLVSALVSRSKLPKNGLVLEGIVEGSVRRQILDWGTEYGVRRLNMDQASSAWIAGDTLLIKLLRKIEDGESPEVELGEHLAKTANFAYTPPVVGHVRVKLGTHEAATVASFHKFIVSQGDAWRFMRDELDATAITT